MGIRADKVGGVTLVDGIRAGDPAAVRTACERLLPAIRPAVRRLLRDSNDVDDVLQDTLVRALKRLPEWVSDESLEAWMQRVAINLAYDLHRQRRRRPTVPLIDAVLASSLDGGATEPEAAVLASWRAASVRQAMGQLPDRDRDLLHAREVDDEPIPRLADRFGMTEGAIRVALTRARARLRALVTEQGLPALLPVGPAWVRAKHSLVRWVPDPTPLFWGVVVLATACVLPPVDLIDMAGKDAAPGPSAVLSWAGGLPEATEERAEIPDDLPLPLAETMPIVAVVPGDDEPGEPGPRPRLVGDVVSLPSVTTSDQRPDPEPDVSVDLSPYGIPERWDIRAPRPCNPLAWPVDPCDEET